MDHALTQGHHQTNLIVHTAIDAVIAGAAISAPIWVTELQWLLTLTGAILAIPLLVLRIRLAWRQLQRRRRDDD